MDRCPFACLNKKGVVRLGFTRVTLQECGPIDTKYVFGPRPDWVDLQEDTDFKRDACDDVLTYLRIGFECTSRLSTISGVLSAFVEVVRILERSADVVLAEQRCHDHSLLAVTGAPLTTRHLVIPKDVSTPSVRAALLHLAMHLGMNKAHWMLHATRGEMFLQEFVRWPAREDTADVHTAVISRDMGRDTRAWALGVNALVALMVAIIEGHPMTRVFEDRHIDALIYGPEPVPVDRWPYKLLQTPWDVFRWAYDDERADEETAST